MPGRLGPRFAIETLFLIALAIGAGLADLATRWIVLIMAAGWLVVALLELTAERLWSTVPVWRRPYYPAVVPSPPAQPAAEPVVEAEPEPVVEAEPEPVVEPEAVPEPEPELVPAAVEAPEPESEPEPEPELVPAAVEAPEPDPEPEPEAEPETVIVSRADVEAGAARAAEAEPEPARDPAIAAEAAPEPMAEPEPEPPPRPRLEPLEPPRRRRWFGRRQDAILEFEPEPAPPPKHVRLLPPAPRKDRVADDGTDFLDEREGQSR